MRVLAWLLLTTLVGFPPRASFADSNEACMKLAQYYQSVDKSRPNAPPRLTGLASQNEITKFGGCDRQFAYKGKSHPIDSYYRKDAENLRPIMENTPGAVQHLNTYQYTRSQMNLAAFTGTFGLLVTAFGLFGNTLFQGNTQSVVRNVGLFGGLTIAAASGVYALGMLHLNENRLDDAVTAYNQSHPETKIQLLFRTEGLF